MNALRKTLLGLILLASVVQAEYDSPLRDAGSLGGIRLAGSENPGLRKVYIVQLQAPAAASLGASMRTVAGAPGTSRARFDKTNAAVQEYAAQLAAQQDRVLARAGAGAELLYRYQYGLNGFAARMHPSQAHKLAQLSEVLQVWEDEIRPLSTNHSLEFLGLFDSEKGLRGKPGLDGEGIVIGVIDSGIAPEHPALRDTRAADRPSLCSSDWAENSFLGKWLCHRYEKQEDILLFDEAQDWHGDCQSGERFTVDDCNNKLIGARWFIAGAEATGPIDDGEIRSARDADGHGTHTATTAAGNRVRASIFDTFIGRVEGVAPRARIAVYKACWLRPDTVRASCNTSDLANAIDAAVADGVDIINYSVGSSLTRITAPDDIALLAATKAGVLSVVAAGNDGPGYGTIGSPAGGPWVITAAASTRDGETTSEAMKIQSPASIAGLYIAREANFTAALKSKGPLEGSLVLVDDADGTTSDACSSLDNGSDVSGKIAFVQRGNCTFEQKIANAEAAGAKAVVVFNIAGDAIVMNGAADAASIPAVMIGQADGNLILAELDRGSDVRVLLDKTLFLTESDTGNRMASFSSRGPGPTFDILKPDVTAPGVNILAGFTPDAANATKGENFAYLSGTSMSTPHVAGVAALLLQAHPTWSPAALKSALMTTARRNLTQADGETAAGPFELGAGHIVPNDAVDPGIVYDVSDEEYDAFACGIASPAVTAERCGELQAGGYSFSGEDLNQPSIAIARLIGTQTVRRHLSNVSDESLSFSAQVVAPPGISVSVIPDSIMLAPGASASFDVTLSHESGSLDLWRFGSLTWSNNERDVFSTLAVWPRSVDAPAELTREGVSGSLSFPVQFGYQGPYTAGVHGLRLPLVINGFVDSDPTKTFSFRTDNGVTAHLIDVTPNQAMLRFALFDAFTDGNDDLDMYVYFCENNIDCVKIGESGEPTSNEEFNLFYPQAGRYAVLIHGFETDNSTLGGGPGANYKLLGWSFGLVDDPGNMTASGPAFVDVGSTENVSVNWSGLQTDTIYLGGISHNTPQGISAITVVRIVVPAN